MYISNICYIIKQKKKRGILMIFKWGNSIKKTDYHKTKIACYMGFITQAIAANFAPLLFLKFHTDYHISLGNIALISTCFFFTQLGKEKAGGDQCNISKGNMIICVKFQKQQRCKICCYSLGDKAHITGNFCLMVVSFFYRIPPFKNHKYTSFLFLLDYIANIGYIH